ncbi:hypothetical protein FA13DRAFT_1745803 [Coprinellus micaceus]|uniref:Uncharacterized protein n=1 Tax=Coprinellus micaceus TaxID=71717 RepID=A0A4Y7SA30_COPMI|nr:hypothetical protein FA13DRAFT_1745803 [Coprinellus micaceus]
MPMSRGTENWMLPHNHRSSFRGGRIPQDAITAARKLGNVDGLLNLIAGVNGSNYRMEVLDVIFHHLSPDSLRPPDVPSQFEATATWGHIQKIMRERAHWDACDFLQLSEGTTLRGHTEDHPASG